MSKLAFPVILIGTVVILTGFATWVTKVSVAGMRRESVVHRTWGLLVLFAVMSAAGAWDMFVARHPFSFVNGPLFVCGSVAILQLAALWLSARKNYGEAEMRKVIARDI